MVCGTNDETGLFHCKKVSKNWGYTLKMCAVKCACAERALKICGIKLRVVSGKTSRFVEKMNYEILD